MEVSALKHAGVAGINGRSPLLRLQSDERLIALVRRGNHGAFEVLVARYQSRLLAFCRHMLGSREDAEDVLQEVFAAAFNAILADDRPINARPWLYRIARNRSLNHLRRQQPIGVDSMDVHLADHGTTTADKVHKREEFRELIADVQDLPETQRTALLLREIDALSYEQIAEAMETTIPSVKSLLVRARVSLAEAAEARQLSCDEVRLELGEIAEGLKRRTTPPVRRHLRTCAGCSGFRQQLRSTNKALAAVMPVGFALAFRRMVLAHLGISASAGGSASSAAGAAAGSAVAGSATGGLISAGMSTVATKAAAGLAAAALVTAGAVEIEHRVPRDATPPAPIVAQAPADVQAQPAPTYRDAPAQVQRALDAPDKALSADRKAAAADLAAARSATLPADAAAAARAAPVEPTTTTPATTTTPVDPAVADGTTVASTVTPQPAGQTQVESGTTALPSELPANQPPQTVAAATPPTATSATPPPSTEPVTTLPAETTPPPATTTPTPTTPSTPPPTDTTPQEPAPPVDEAPAPPSGDDLPSGDPAQP